MPAFVERMKGFWRDAVIGPRLRSYETACEELGGVPWRTVRETERWFVGAGAAPPPVPAEALDSSSLRILRPSLAELLRARAAWIVGGAALIALVIGGVTLSSGGTALAAQRPAPVAPAPAALAAQAPSFAQAPSLAPAPVSAPARAVSAPTIARHAASPRPRPAADGLSPSVRALFSGPAGSHKSARTRRHRRHR